VTAITSLIATIGLFFPKQKTESLNKEIIFTLNASYRDVGKYWRHLKYSFFRDEFVHPMIIKDLQGSIADTGEQVVAVNLIDSQDSNKYSGEIRIRDIDNSHYPYVYCEEGRESFGYAYIGTSTSGIHVLRTFYCCGGSGIYIRLIFLVLETDESIEYDFDHDDLTKRQRINIKTLGSLGLGDRYDGEITFKDGILKIGKDIGWFGSRRESKDKYIKLE
jgi:hypothetical protein